MQIAITSNPLTEVTDMVRVKMKKKDMNNPEVTPSSDPVKKGAARMIQLGYKQVQVWLDKKEYEALLSKTRGSKATYLRKLLCEDAGIQFHYR